MKSIVSINLNSNAPERGVDLRLDGGVKIPIGLIDRSFVFSVVQNETVFTSQRRRNGRKYTHAHTPYRLNYVPPPPPPSRAHCRPFQVVRLRVGRAPRTAVIGRRDPRQRHRGQRSYSTFPSICLLVVRPRSVCFFSRFPRRFRNVHVSASSSSSGTRLQSRFSVLVSPRPPCRDRRNGRPTRGHGRHQR